MKNHVYSFYLSEIQGFFVCYGLWGNVHGTFPTRKGVEMDDKRKGKQSLLALRFNRGQNKRNKVTVAPFTELPPEIRRSQFSFWRMLQGILNFLMLLILGLALVGLVYAFAYQMENNPQMLADWSNDLIRTVEGWLQSLLADISA
jgi:hypothetical protein